MSSTPPATIRSRITHTAKRLRHLAKVVSALNVLQRQRRKQLAAATSSGPRVMFDSINLMTVPTTAQAVAGYVGGKWPTFGQLASRFPHAKHLSIAVASTQDAECLDVEPGDAPPALAPAWVKRQHARGIKRPVVYTSVSGAQALVNLLAANGLPRGSYRLWTAHYDFHEHLCGPQCGFGMKTTADATQWTDKALGRVLDQSLCSATFWD